MNFKKNESETKLRGGYYTPKAISKFLARWILEKKPKTILEPSCGDGSFIKALHNLYDYPIQFTGVEIHSLEAKKAEESAPLDQNLHVTIKNEDFLALSLREINADVLYEAVVGNPPYIRYQYLSPEDQKLSETIFSRHNLPFTKHTNAWVPFVIASLDLLAPGGRLGMVIPSELLHVLHATSLRKHLMNECRRILIIDPIELLFEEALQGTILLMIEKKAQADETPLGVAVTAVRDNSFLSMNPSIFFDNANYVSGEVLNGKWMKVLLLPEELRVFEKVKTLPTIHKFSDVAEVDVGIVTGANKFFLVDTATVNKYDLAKFAHPMFGRSEHCPGIIYDKKTHSENINNGLPSNFIYFKDTPYEELPTKAQEYIQLGEVQELHTRYKCRIRKPWYLVPSVYSTPIGMLKRSHHYPRLILNKAEAYTTDTAYRIRTLSDTVSADHLVYGFINSLTALTAELEGRHYGGGVLELVPSEIEKLLVPLPDINGGDLMQLDKQIRQSIQPEILLQQQDKVVLTKAGLSEVEIAIIHQAWRRVRTRRHRLLSHTDKNGD